MTDQAELFRIRRNLRDAGMNDDQIAECVRLLEEQKYPLLEKLLTKHRLALLASVHQYNSRIDCLDYFTRMMKRRNI